MNSKLVLFGSLAANAVLAALVVFLLNRAPAPDRAEDPGPAGAKSLSAEQPAPAAASLTAVEDETGLDAAPFDWRRVESADYHQYVANLRAIGCPAETIRDIIVADVNKLFAARAKAESGTNRFQYWKGGSPLGNLLSEETIAQQQAMGKEKRELLQSLLAGETPQDLGSHLNRHFYESMLDFMPPEKQNQVKEIEERFAGKLLGTVKKASEGDPSAMRAVQAEKEAELLALLGPEEKFQYDLRMSQTAMLMRMRMGDLDVSEKEFQDLFRLRKQVDDEFGIEGMGAPAAGDKAKLEAARKEMNAQIETLLGERYPEYKYEMSGEWAAQMLHRIANENHVPRTDAIKAYTMTDIARAEAEIVKADANRSEAQKQAAFQAIHDETVRSVTQVLGQEAAESYFKKIALIPGFKSAQ
jgi:hypothetical protein